MTDFLVPGVLLEVDLKSSVIGITVSIYLQRDFKVADDVADGLVLSFLVCSKTDHPVSGLDDGGKGDDHRLVSSLNCIVD